MSEPTESTKIFFHGKYGNFLSLYSIAYDDFRTKTGAKFIQIKENHTFHYVRNGKGTLAIKNKTYSLNGGDFFYIPPDVPVRYYPDKHDPWRYYVFHIDDDFGGEFASLMGFTDSNYVYTSKFPHQTEALFDNIFSVDSPPAEIYHLLSSCLIQILAMSRIKDTPEDETPRHSDIVEKTKRIIELNYKNPDFTINTIAEMLYITHSYISRLFKAKIGMTPIAYLTDTRLAHAAELIREKKLSARQLSEAVGFSDELYFMKCFKKKFGVTVREYRKQTENEKTV